MNKRDQLILEYSQDAFFAKDMMAFLCGELIGQGCYRDVFQYALDPRYVIKIQRDCEHFSNVIEFQLWSDIMYTEYKKWFAPCIWMSCDGRILIQRKTMPITKTKRPPERIPYFFSDIKESNFGFIGKQFVAHDYDFSLSKFISFGLNNKTKLWKPHS